MKLKIGLPKLSKIKPVPKRNKSALPLRKQESVKSFSFSKPKGDTFGEKKFLDV